MPDAFENVLGQPQVRDFLRKSVKGESVTHAYLFTGPTGSNKTLAAYALAQALLCPKGPQGPRGGSCGACDICGRVIHRKHPDVHYYAPAGASGHYLIDQVREVIADTSLAPIQASRKVYIIDRADQLGVSAANALLKTLEEPPDDVVLVLLGRTRESVLPTIVSRCQVVPFRHIPADEAAGIVSQNTGAPAAQARMAIEACGGSLTRAVEFLRAPGNERLAFRAEVLEIMASLAAADSWDVIGYARRILELSKAPVDGMRALQEAEVSENSEFLAKSALRQLAERHKRQLSAKTREGLMQATAIMGSWLRDVMMVRAGTPELVVNVDAADALAAAAAQADEASLARALAAVGRCDQAIAYNVSPETCFDALLFDVKEVLNGTGSACASRL